VLGYAVAIAAVRGRRRLSAAALAAALVVLALPVVTFLAGAVAPESGSVALYTVALFAVAGALAAGVWFPLRRRPWLPPLVLCAATWVVLVVDVATGGHLQLDTVLGYSPTVAGRFQGYGNLAFALLSSVAVVLATGWFGWRGGARRALVAAGALLALTVVVDGFPTLGADVGGVLASAPAYAIVVALLARWRLGWRRVLVVAGAAIGLVVVFALVDLARPAASRTHLGRFADRLVHGEAGTILRRKVVTNLEVVVRQPAALLVPLLFVALVLLVTRSRALVALRQRTRGLDACLVGMLVLAVVGFAVNDSGLAIPAMMIGVVVPWLVTLVLRGSPP
jgi:MFS family permease